VALYLEMTGREAVEAEGKEGEVPLRGRGPSG